MKEYKVPHPKKLWAKPEVRMLSQEDVARLPPEVKARLLAKVGTRRRVA
jgi:hypothetical protein